MTTSVPAGSPRMGWRQRWAWLPSGLSCDPALSARLGLETEPAAHAWVTWEGRPVIGGGLPTGQAEIARFR